MPNEYMMGAEGEFSPPANAPNAEAKAKTGSKKSKAGVPAEDQPTGRPSFLMPPQGPGVPRRVFSTGSPQSQQRLGVAALVLRDPVARSSFSRPYSGQSRPWSR